MCLIGASKTHSKCERPAVLDNITKRINTEKEKSSSNTSVSFVPREKLEKVKNCTKIDKKVQQQFVMKIVEKLLEIPTPVENKGQFEILPMPMLEIRQDQTEMLLFSLFFDEFITFINKKSPG